MTVKNPERISLCSSESARGLFPRHFEIKGKGFFCHLYKSSESVRPYKRQTAKRPPSCCGLWVGDRVPKTTAEKRCFQNAALLMSMYQGWREGEGREEGKKLDGSMDTKTLWREGAEAGTKQTQKRKVKRNHGRSWLLQFPTAPRKAKSGLAPTSRSPALRAAACKQPPSFREHRDESLGLQGNPSPQRTWAGL